MVGDKLRRERERQGLTIKDVEQGTSIRALYIEAIENGEWETLPGDVYTKGFIRNVATFLNIDANACVAEYTAETSEASAEPIAEEGTAAVGEKTVGATDGGVKVSPDFGRNIGSKQRRQTGLMAVMGLIVICGAAYLFMTADDGKQATKIRPNENATVTAEQTAPVKPAEAPAVNAATKPAVTPAADNKSATSSVETNKNDDKNKQQTAKSANAAQNKNGVELTATFNDRCWMKVVADGAVIYEGTVEKGNTMSWKGNERIAITAGNAGALSVTHNGKNVGQVGAYGEVVNRTFTKEGAN